MIWDWLFFTLELIPCFIFFLVVIGLCTGESSFSVRYRKRKDCNLNIGARLLETIEGPLIMIIVQFIDAFISWSSKMNLFQLYMPIPGISLLFAGIGIATFELVYGPSRIHPYLVSTLLICGLSLIQPIIAVYIGSSLLLLSSGYEYRIREDTDQAPVVTEREGRNVTADVTVMLFWSSLFTIVAVAVPFSIFFIPLVMLAITMFSYPQMLALAKAFADFAEELSSLNLYRWLAKKSIPEIYQNSHLDK